MLNPADYLTPEGEELYATVEATLVPNGDQVIDEAAGDLETDGYRVSRVGSVVLVSTWDGRGAIDHGTVAKAEREIAALGNAA